MNKPERSTSRMASFRNAFSGWWYVLRTQRNAWLHAIATCIVIALGLFLRIDWGAWATLFLAIGLVWTAEFVNTALEAIVDLASPEMHPLARVGKDVGAAAVLIASLVALLIGLFILGPPLVGRILRVG